MSRLLVVFHDGKSPVSRFQYQFSQVSETFVWRYRYHRSMHHVASFEQFQVQPAHVSHNHYEHASSAAAAAAADEANVKAQQMLRRVR